MTVIDTHTHFFPEEWVGLLQREGPAHGATVGRNEKGAVTSVNRLDKLSVAERDLILGKTAARLLKL